jgi:hypothetical protein
MIDSCRDTERLELHGLSALAVAHWSSTGQPVPKELVGVHRHQAVAWLQTEELLRELHSILQRPLLVLKGIEVAKHYPEPGWRRLRDLDVLVEDPAAAQDALVAAGWRLKPTPGFLRDPRGDTSLHQLCPIERPGFSLPVELHRRPNGPTWSSMPDFSGLFDRATPRAQGIDGAWSLSVEDQAIVVLGHSCARQPFEQFSQIIDFALLSASSSREALVELARRARLERLLSVAEQTVESLLLGSAPEPLVTRLFSSHLHALDSVSSSRAQLDRYGASLLLARPGHVASAACRSAWRRARTAVRAGTGAADMRTPE